MGEIISGKNISGKQRKRYPVERCICLSLSVTLQNGWITPYRSLQLLKWSNWAGDVLISLAVEVIPDGESMRFYIRESGQVLDLHSAPLHFGGVRWWFSCLDCKQRRAALYLAAGNRFSCRVCLNLTYQSCNHSNMWIMGQSMASLKAHVKEKNWFRYPRWRRKRDRRPDYRDRGALLRELADDRFFL